MSDLPAEPVDGDDVDLSERPSNLTRASDLLGRSNSPIRKYLAEKIKSIAEGFEAQANRSDDLDKWWNIYNCELDDNQYYNGNAQIYVPIIRDAVNARCTRFSNQLFPQSGRYVDVTSTDGSVPWEIAALLNHYIAHGRLETEAVKPLMRNGDIEGQYNLYVDWETVTRHIVSRETHGAIDPQTQVEIPGREVVEIVEEKVEEGRPVFEVLHDSDVLVLPQTADSIEQALSLGGSVTIVRRWSKEKHRQMIEDKEIEGDPDGDDARRTVDAMMTGLSDMQKKLARAVGVRAKGPHIVMFESWALAPLKISEKSGIGFSKKKGEMMLCRFWWGVDREPLGCKRNPNWNDRCPLLSAPVEKIAGVFKGKSLVEPLAELQWEANDAANERADADHYGAMPIITRKPGEGNAPLILNLAAIWDIAPDDIKFMAFPDLSQRANARIMAATQVIFQSLGVNPAMLPQQSGRPGAKRNQAEVAQEQSVDLLTVAEAVKVPTQAILTPLAGWIVDLDHQHRDKDMLVRKFGMRGVMAAMEEIPPLQSGSHYEFIWAGAEQARLTVAMMQQGMALLNAASNGRMAQQLQQEGYQLRIGPALERAFLNVFGPEIGCLTLVDQRHQLGLDTETEIQLMLDGNGTAPNPLDNDPEKIQAFQAVMAQMGDPHGMIRIRLRAQLQQLQAKQQAMMMQQMQRQLGGPPPQQGQQQGQQGQGARPPQSGAVPAGPRQLRAPPGAIPPDQMMRAGAVMPPRRM
jgi:hypothetical protein